MWQIILILGIICGALSLYLIPHAFHLKAREDNERLEQAAHADRDTKHKEQMKHLKVLPEISSDVSNIKDTLSKDEKERKLMYYEASGLESKNGGYY